MASIKNTDPIDEEILEWIIDKGLIHVGSGGTLVYDSRLERKLKREQLDNLLVVAMDNIEEGEEGECMDWPAIKDEMLDINETCETWAASAAPRTSLYRR